MEVMNEYGFCPILSNFFMEYFDKNKVNHYNFKTTIWWRNIYDVFLI